MCIIWIPVYRGAHGLHGLYGYAVTRIFIFKYYYRNCRIYSHIKCRILCRPLCSPADYLIPAMPSAAPITSADKTGYYANLVAFYNTQLHICNTFDYTNDTNESLTNICQLTLLIIIKQIACDQVIRTYRSYKNEIEIKSI